MGNEFNKTEADFAYERYKKMGGISPEQDIPVDDIRPTGTITAQSVSGGPRSSELPPLESALASHEPIGAAPVDFDGVVDDGTDPVLANDKYLAADIGLNAPDSAAEEPGEAPAYRQHTAPDRDELVESDALIIASAAGLTGGTVDYADEEELYRDDEQETELEEEDFPLEDVPDADDIEEDTPIDPASPPPEILHGIDILNGSRGE